MQVKAGRPENLPHALTSRSPIDSAGSGPISGGTTLG